MDTTIAIISELISSIAPVGVAITLLLESRQLRTSQIQAARTLDGELIRLAVDYPSIAEVVGLRVSSDDYPKYAFLNLLLESWEMGYQLQTMPAKAVQGHARTMFNSEYARSWWPAVRKVWDDSAATKREKEFVALVDGEFGAATSHEPGRDQVDGTNEPDAE
jgi:hypothetical protein